VLLDVPRPASFARALAPAPSGLRAPTTVTSLPHFHARCCPAGASSILRKAAASFAQETLIYWGYWFGGGGEAVETRAAETASHREAPAADGPAPV